MIVLAIKSYFFSGADSYSCGQKPHTFHYFLSFYREMIRVVCTMLAVAIKDLEMPLGNLNLSFKKGAI